MQCLLIFLPQITHTHTSIYSTACNMSLLRLQPLLLVITFYGAQSRRMSYGIVLIHQIVAALEGKPLT